MIKISDALTVVDSGKAYTTAFQIERRKFKLRDDHSKPTRAYVRISMYYFCLIEIKAD